MNPSLPNRNPVPAWPVVVALLAAIGLLLAFVFVVRYGVAQGSLRRAAMTAEDAARRQCGMLSNAQTRSDCRSQLGSAAANAGLERRPATLTAEPSARPLTQPTTPRSPS